MLVDPYQLLLDYRNKGERVDEVLFQVITDELNKMPVEKKKWENGFNIVEKALIKSTHENKQLQEAFDVKTTIYDKLNKDYINVREENKRLREALGLEDKNESS